MDKITAQKEGAFYNIRALTHTQNTAGDRWNLHMGEAGPTVWRDAW